MCRWKGCMYGQGETKCDSKCFLRSSPLHLPYVTIVYLYVFIDFTAKFTSLQPTYHPRYPVGTFVSCNKSNSISILQMQEPAAGDQV